MLREATNRPPAKRLVYLVLLGHTACWERVAYRLAPVVNTPLPPPCPPVIALLVLQENSVSEACKSTAMLDPMQLLVSQRAPRALQAPTVSLEVPLLLPVLTVNSPLDQLRLRPIATIAPLVEHAEVVYKQLVLLVRILWLVKVCAQRAPLDLTVFLAPLLPQFALMEPTPLHLLLAAWHVM